MNHYVVALTLTIGVEALSVAALADGAPRRRLLLVSLFANLLTHPLANLAFATIAAHTGTTTAFAAIETGVVLAEALIYVQIGDCPPKRAAALALVANGASMTLSLFFL